MQRRPTLKDPRKSKSTPDEDLWHTLKIGVPVAVLLFVVLPIVLNGG